MLKYEIEHSDTCVDFFLKTVCNCEMNFKILLPHYELEAPRKRFQRPHWVLVGAHRQQTFSYALTVP